MGKSKQEKAALKAAKKAAKMNNINNTEKTTTSVVEQKVEETQKVETPKPKATENKEAPKQETKNKLKKQEKIPTFIPEEVNETPQERALKRATNLVNTVGIPNTQVDTNGLTGKSMLSYVMWEKYGKNEELSKHYPELYNDLMRNIDVLNMLALMDLKQDLLQRQERGELRITVDIDQIAPLKSIADMLGIELLNTPCLENKNKTQLELNFKEEVKKEIEKEEKKEYKIETDPSKITNEDQVIETLNGLLRETPNMAKNLVDTVDFYRSYRIYKEENADKKLELDNKQVSDWINEIFKLIQPTVILKGLGRAMYLYTSQQGSPLMAHSILHHHVSNYGWNEEQIASMLKALIEENFRYSLKDDPKRTPNDDKALQIVTNGLGDKYIDQLLDDYNIDSKVENLDKKNSRELARKIVSCVSTNYFGKKGSVDYVPPTIDQIRMQIGRIINLYRDPSERLEQYIGTIPPSNVEDKKK